MAFNFSQFLDLIENVPLVSVHFAGVLILVIAYTAMGSILFMTLEGDDDIMGMGKTVETAVAASKPRTDLVNADIRSR